MSNNEEVNYSKAKNKKRRKRTKKQTCLDSFQNDCQAFSYNLKSRPQKTLKKYLVRIGIYIWSFAVFLSMLSLIGVPVTSLFQKPSDTNEVSSYSRVLRASDSDAERLEDTTSTDFWGSISNNLFMLSDLGGETDFEVQIEEPTDPDVDEIEIPEQVLPSTPKQGNKLNKKFEKELSCQEEDCNASCNKKIKVKCSRSASCRRDRERLCKRRCRKQRCEDRCKEEPKFGYVEREQRMEKCKDECSGPTAVHNKCIKKCHSQFKPCKSRCNEIAGKYSCDRLEIKAETITSLFEDEELI